MTPRFKIIVVGAGFAGLSAAIALSKKGHQVILLEAANEFQNTGGLLTLGPNAFRVLDGYGIYKEMVKACEIDMQASRVRRFTGEIIAEASPNQYESLYGYRRIVVVRPVAQSILHQLAEREGVEIRLGCQVKGVDQARSSVTLQDGTTVEGDLIVAADGIRSAVRQHCIGEIPILQANLDVCRILLPEEKLHSNPKLSHLANTSDVWLGPGRIIVASAIRADTSLFYGMELAYPATKGETGRPPKRLDIEEVKEKFFDFDPIIQHVMSAADDAWLWTLHQIPTDIPWVNETGFIVLTGDAAHAMLPHSAQGGAMCLEDGAALAECLDRATSKSDIPACLEAFETIRKPRTTLISKTGDEQCKIMVSKDPKQIEQRNQQRKERAALLPEIWNGDRIDKVPDSFEDPMYGHWVFAHDTVGFTNRQLDIIFGSKNRR